jgi:hypothetical protein
MAGVRNERRLETMPTIGRLWAGRIYGTNTGNFFLEIEPLPEGELTGTFRLNDTILGLTVYRVAGTFDGTTLRLEGDPNQAEAPQGGVLGAIKATGALTPEGLIRGTWTSSLGTAGTFEAYPHDQAAPDQRTTAAQPPEQLYTSTVSVGAVRIYGQDLWALVQFIRKDFVVGRPVITYAIRGNEVTKYIEDFQRDAPTLGQLRRLKLVIQEPEAYGINKVVALELNAGGQNEVRVQGINESWVTGKAETIARMLRKLEKPLVTRYKKYGVTLNQVIFLGMLVLIPAIHSLWQRAVFVLVVVLLLHALVWVHQRFIPNATLNLSEDEPTSLQRVGPTILSWLIAVTASLAAAVLFRWLTR